MASVNCDTITSKNAQFVTVIGTPVTNNATQLSTVTLTGATAPMTFTPAISSFGDMWMLVLPLAGLVFTGTGTSLAVASIGVPVDKLPSVTVTKQFYVISITGPMLAVAELHSDGSLTIVRSQNFSFNNNYPYTLADTIIAWKMA